MQIGRPTFQRDAHDRRVGEFGHARRHVTDDLVADRKEHKSVEHAKRAQCDDQGRQLESGDEECVDHTETETDDAGD